LTACRPSEHLSGLFLCYISCCRSRFMCRLAGSLQN
jgi:hypothetical protein